MGTLFATTLPEETLDWALVKIEYLAFSNLNPSVLDAIDELFWGPEVMYPKSIANEPLDCRVFICTGSSDSVIEGTLSSVASFSRLPGAKNFQQLWTVRRLDGEFSKFRTAQ
jgi:hypothetical protein